MRFAIRTALALFAALALPTIPAGAQEQITSYQTDKAFEEAMGDLSDAIVNRGYVVDYHGFIGDMLKRTAADVGSSKALYSNAEFVQFCSAVMSRAAMEQDVDNIAYCPYVLFAYEVESMPGKVTVGFRRLPDGPGRDEINAMLEEIAKEASGQ